MSALKRLIHISKKKKKKKKRKKKKTAKKVSKFGFRLVFGLTCRKQIPIRVNMVGCL